MPTQDETKAYKEWILQSDYDYETAEAMFSTANCSNDKKSITAIITFLKDEFKKKGVELRGIALFGSQLNGSSNPDSDIDLIIVSDTFQNKNIFESSDITMDVEIKALKKIHFPMDILKMTDEEFNQGLRNKRFNAQLI